jgi:murein DD-endopeptidase MepM/ murein hydrolase activator NlpD
MARLPIEGELGEGIWVTPHGAYGQPRPDSASGGCGVGVHPCVHWGVDLGAAVGTAVVAPERGEVHYSMASPMLPPLRGYQPGAVLMRGVSGAWHVLGHLVNMTTGDHRAAPTPQGGWSIVEEGQKLGEIGGAHHVHWEVRADRFGTKVDPAAWLKLRGSTDATMLKLLSKAGAADAAETDWLLLAAVGVGLYLATR